MPYRLAVGRWGFVGHWGLVVGCSAAVGLLAGCCSELRTGWDAYNDGVRLRTSDPDQSAKHFESARSNLTHTLKSCDLSPTERQRVLLMLVRIELYRGDPNAAGVILALSGFRPGKNPGSPWPDRTIALLTTAEIFVYQGMYNLAVIADLEASGYKEWNDLRSKALNQFDNSFIYLNQIIRQNEDPSARDLAIAMLAQARFEKAKAMELHDEATREANLTAAGAELDALAKDMAERAPEHPDLLREYKELMGKIAKERQRVANALGR